MESTRKEAVVAYPKILSRHLHRGTEKKKVSIGIADLVSEI
jgi:hypothetical protein